MNGVASEPLALNPLVMTGGPSVMLNVVTWLPLPAPLLATTVGANEPIAVGMPEIRPVVVLSVRPGGNAPVKLKPLLVPLLAVI